MTQQPASRPDSSATVGPRATPNILLEPGALLGLTGTTLLALGATDPAFAHDPAGWGWPPVQALGELVGGRGPALTLVGIAALIVAWIVLRPRLPQDGRHAWLLLALWSLPLLVVPPVLSADAFAYVEIGWIAHLGLDPGAVELGTVGGPYAAAVDDLWIGSVIGYYPPLSILANRLGLELMGLHPYGAMVGQRIVSLIGVALVVAFLPRVARLLGRPAGWTVWLGALNPLFVVHAVGGAHVDALMVGLAVVGVWIAVRPSASQWPALVLAPAAIALASAVKPHAVVVLVAVAGLPVVAQLARTSRAGALKLLLQRSLATLPSFAVMFAVVSWASGLGFSWIGHLLAAQGADRQLITFSPAYLVGDLLARVSSFVGADPAAAHRAGYVLVLVAAFATLAWLVVTRPHRPLELAAWAAVLAGAAQRAVLPWYLLLGIALLGLARVSEGQARAIVWVLAAYSFAGLGMSGHMWAVLVLLLAVVVILALAHRIFQQDEPLVTPS